ncbi:hydroxymethylglutaryl-CoA synthase [Halorientalis persicus]|uniref:Hydroxymethylglutaryl-CoA synthase n=1 Tax=Halorientalis persicus TaxID=1367881 RepID=A0A1H8TPJ3_9EURY|nr:zinc ribbon domain-containing protein [Halorientalis persicus]SEO92378.1 hydroxymethylglutaryl-CoA synthase [Halorientalis persicus]
MTDDSREGIRAVGAYAPRLRVAAEEFAEAWGSFEASGIEEKAVPEADEDALTMGWEAARRALAAGDADAAEVDWLGFATTNPPMAEEDPTVRLGSFLGVADDTTRQTFTGSTRAGTRALFAALEAETDGVALVVAADCPQGEPSDAHEHAAGAGAAAFLVGPDAPAPITDRAEHAEPYPGTRFRRAGSEDVEGIDVTSYDREAFRETLAGAVDAVDADDPDAAAVQAPDGGLPYRAAGAMGLDNGTIHTCATVQELGDTAAASVPLSLAKALADGHETVLGAGYGSGGGADAFVVEADESVPADLAIDGGTDLTYAEYLRRRGDVTSGEPNGGAAYVSVPTWKRSIPQRHRLVAGRCPECGSLAFPPEGACPDCRSLVEFEPVELPDTGEVEAVTAVSRGGEPPEFAVQQQKSGEYGVAIAAFEADGESVSMPLQIVGAETSPDVGDAVATVIRRIYKQEGVIRYGRKARAEGDE